MNKNKNELDVDFIGGQEPLNKEEERAISNFISSKKEKQKKPPLKPKTQNRKNSALSNV